jgi:pimeloyl-ACP methyl ester carboxylesterase
MAKMSRKYLYNIKINNFSTQYYKKGEGKKLVILPGLRTDIERIAEVLEYYSQHFETYYVDLPGYGKSIKSKSYSYKEMVSFLDEWLRLLDLDKFHIMGMSLTGPAAYYLLQKPYFVERTDKLILFAPWYSRESINLSWGHKIFFWTIYSLGSLPILSWIGQKAYENENLVMKVVKKLHPKTPLNKDFRKFAKNFKNFNYKVCSKTTVDLLRLNMDHEKDLVDKESFIIMSEYDNKLNYKKTIAGYQRLFPNIKTISLKNEFHAPTVWITKELIEHYFSGVLDEILGRNPS